MGSLRDYFKVQDAARQYDDCILTDSTKALAVRATKRLFPWYSEKSHNKELQQLGPLGYVVAKAEYMLERPYDSAIAKGYQPPPLPPQSVHKILVCITGPHLEDVMKNILYLWKHDKTFWQTKGTPPIPEKPSTPLVVMLDQEMPAMNLLATTIKVGGEDLTHWLKAKKHAEELLAGLSYNSRKKLKAIHYEYSSDTAIADKLCLQLMPLEAYQELCQTATDAVNYGQRVVCTLNQQALVVYSDPVFPEIPSAYNRVIIAAPADLWYVMTTLNIRGERIPVLKPYIQGGLEIIFNAVPIIMKDLKYEALKAFRHKKA